MLLSSVYFFYLWKWVSEWGREWVSDILAISWREQVNFQRDDDEVRFILDKYDELDFHSASSLKQ
jgi:hypothetical protein